MPAKTINKKTTYLGNDNLRPAGFKHTYTAQERAEFIKCAEDPIYFIRNYVKIVSLDKGIVLFDMFPFQEKYIRMILGERKVVCKLFRQGGKTTSTAAAILWYVIFNDTKTVGIMANKANAAREILARIQLMYELLPHWLKHGIKEWNKGNIELDNGSKIFTSATSGSAGRGKSINWLYLDEFAFVPNNIAEEFFTSVFPTLSSGKESKITITSTPIGYNAFWRIWDESERSINGFVNFTANYWERPGYDEKWAEDQRRVLGELKFRQEILMSFLGSSNTLIAPDVLAKMTPHEFEYQKDSLDVLVPPHPQRVYTIVVDTSRGLSQDSSAFTVIDSTELPYKLVAKYKNNTIAPMLYPSVIYKVAKDYNNAYVLVEINDNGQQIADILYSDLEYENMLFVSREKGGQRLSAGFKGQSNPGVRTDKLVKRVGCTTLRDLIHENKLLIHDADVIQELSTFIEVKGTFAADDGYHDDTTMTLVLFAWMTTQSLFRDLMNVNMRESIYKQRIENIEAELTPFGIIVDGTEEEEAKYVKEDGDLWTAVEFARDELIEGLALGDWGWS